MPIRPENRERYPKDWKLRSFFVRFIRAKGRCEWCGARHGGIGHWSGPVFLECDPDMLVAMDIKPVKIILTTAHVFDHRPEASSLLNLAALCQKCHNGHDMKARREGTRARRLAASGQMALC